MRRAKAIVCAQFHYEKPNWRRRTTGRQARAHTHVHILIRWQVDTSSTVALYSHTMCNLEQRRGSSEASRSSWPSKHTCNNNILMDLSQQARNSRTASSCSRRPSVAHSSSSDRSSEQCTYRDRPHCDTPRIRNFEKNGVQDHSLCLSWFLVLLFAHFILFFIPFLPPLL